MIRYKWRLQVEVGERSTLPDPLPEDEDILCAQRRNGSSDGLSVKRHKKKYKTFLCKERGRR